MKHFTLSLFLCLALAATSYADDAEDSKAMIDRIIGFARMQVVTKALMDQPPEYLQSPTATWAYRSAQVDMLNDELQRFKQLNIKDSEQLIGDAEELLGEWKQQIATMKASIESSGGLESRIEALEQQRMADQRMKEADARAEAAFRDLDKERARRARIGHALSAAGQQLQQRAQQPSSPQSVSFSKDGERLNCTSFNGSDYNCN